jgi:hypothetical protein
MTSSLLTYQDVRTWARAIALRVRRNEAPWHIDKTIRIPAIQERSIVTLLAGDRHVHTIIEADAPKGFCGICAQGLAGPGWSAARHRYGAPDLVIKSAPYTMPAAAQDAWWRPITETGLTEPRWVRAIEIRPSTEKGRRITHHALARLQQTENLKSELFTNDPNVVGDGLFMEWAVGKNGDEMRPGSGRLMLPGSRIIWEVHYHAIGEAITDSVELAIYFYPKGQEPKHREVLALFNTFSGPRMVLDIPPNQVTTTESFVTLRENARIENFQRMHLRGKGMAR